MQSESLIRIVRGDCGESDCWQLRAQTDIGDVRGSVKLRAMSECPNVGIMFHLSTLEAYRRQGIASAMLRELELLAVSSNVSLILATVRVSNFACRVLLESRGWIGACQWLNARTDNDLILYRKILNYTIES